MNRLIFASALLAVASLPAFADDLISPRINPIYAGPIAYDWSGFYIGGFAGHASGSIDTSGSALSTSGALVGIAPGSLDPGSSVGANAGLFPSADASASIAGYLGGVRAGYNTQFGQFLLGAEATLAWPDLRDADAFYGSPLGPFISSSAQVDWYSTITAKGGFAVDNLLLFATAGIAVSQSTGAISVTAGPPGAPGATFADRQTRTGLGLAIGGGAELGVTENVSLTAEYQYVNLGSQSFDFSFPNSSGSTATTTSNVDFHTVKIGLNYRF